MVKTVVNTAAADYANTYLGIAVRSFLQPDFSQRATSISCHQRGDQSNPCDIHVGKPVTIVERYCINETLVWRDRSRSGVNEWGEHKGCELPRHFGKMHTIGPMQRTDHGNKPLIRPLATIREYST